MSACLLLALIAAPQGEVTCPEVRPLIIRYLEDYRGYASPVCRQGWVRPLKHLPIGSDSFVSLGGQARVRWERFSNEGLGRLATDGSGQVQLRAYVHSDAHFSQRLRLFTQFRTATVLDREAARSPLDRDALDLHQLFIETQLSMAGGTLTLRVGRQEVARDFRLVGVREWPNVRLAFDGALASWSNGMLSLDVYGALPVGSEEGVFDDFVLDRLQVVYGLHAVLYPPKIFKGVSLFFVGFYDESSRFVTQVDGSERRESLGLHAWFQEGVLQGGVEGVLQVGHAEGLDVFAWLAAVDVGLQLPLWGGTLRLTTMLEIGSGDDDPDDDVLGSFNAFYPNNRYFGGTAVVGAFSNAIHLLHTIGYSFGPVRTTVEVEQFWRESTRDVVYGPSGFPSVVVPSADDAFIGHQIDAQLGVALGLHVDMLFRLAHFFAGAYPGRRDGTKDTTYVATQLRLIF